MLDVYCHRERRRTDNAQIRLAVAAPRHSATPSTMALRAMYLENLTHSDQPVDDMPPVLQAFDLCGTNVPYWLSYYYPVVCTNLSMAWFYGGMNVTLRGLWTGDDSMVRGIFFHIHFCGISHATKGKGSHEERSGAVLTRSISPGVLTVPAVKTSQKEKILSESAYSVTKVNSFRMNISCILSAEHR
jgi:hypothetical protein